MDIPLGPVYIADSSHQRIEWVKSPDTEEIRDNLLKMLRQITGQPPAEKPWRMWLDHYVIKQLSEFQERRAIDDLKRIAELDPDAEIPGPPAVRDIRARTIILAQEALENILKQDQ